MTYDEIDQKFLDVAKETRKNSLESQTEKLKRMKMGRKGVGKLAALSVSEYVDVMTVKNNEKNGFIMTIHMDDTGNLEAIDQSNINFMKINNHGTSIIMKNPKYSLHKSLDTIAKNISRVFPIFNSDFRLHIIKDSEAKIINSFNLDVLKNLSTIITIGDKYNEYALDEIKFKENKSEIIKEINIKNKAGELVTKLLTIKGWIGTYISTKGQRKDISDFQENHLSIFANGKLGEFNILPRIGQNKLNELYVVGELHVDIFEDSDLPDMALSNREGYKTDDIRYEEASKSFRILLNNILSLYGKYINFKNEDKKNRKNIELAKKEKELKEKINMYKEKVRTDISKKILETSLEDIDKNNLINDMIDSVNIDMSVLGIKSKIDTQKKKILISQTGKDKKISDIIYEMLRFNNIETEQIIYSNSDDQDARIGNREDIYEYLSTFFVRSYSDSKMHVIYITSENMGKSWGAMSEVGAGWITQTNHTVFNINEFIPKAPLNTKVTHGQIECDYDNQNVNLYTHHFDDFCSKIIDICSYIGVEPKTKDENKSKLSEYVSVINSKV